MKQRFLVIGLGRFGRSLAQSLADQGVEVMAVDIDPEVVQELSPQLDAVVGADATDEAALSELEVESFECALVAIGADSIESSILTTALLQKLGVPRILARATSDLHERVLVAIGAHEVVNPEAEMGTALGRRLAMPNLLEHLELGKDTALAEIAVPSSLVGRPVTAAELRRSGTSLVAIRRGERVLAPPSDRERFEAGDVLIVLGSSIGIEDLVARGSP